MTYYKGFSIWYNSLQGWMIQTGYKVVHVSKTHGAAKAWVTRCGHRIDTGERTETA